MHYQLQFLTILALFGTLVAQPMQTAPTDSSRQYLDKILASKTPVVIDFWAPWCAPCRMLSPMIAELKKEYAGKITVMKINIDVHKEIAGAFRVQSIPAVFFVKNKTVVSSLIGLQPKEAYSETIDKVLAMKVEDPPEQKPDSVPPTEKAPSKSRK